jgi:acyl-CoA synthetase (AMP-forming)/AMP-acid ligase II
MQLTLPLHKACIERPHATATVSGARRQNFATFAKRVAKLAGALRSLGIGPADRVGVLAFNSDKMVELIYATWWAGAVINPINVRWTAGEIAFGLDDCATELLVVGPEFETLLPEVQAKSTSLRRVIRVTGSARVDWDDSFDDLVDRSEPMPDAERNGDDLAAILYTGGTTGRPKGVMLSHASLSVDALGALAASPRPPEPVGLVVAPLFHVGGLALMLQLMARLATLVLTPVFDEPAILRLIAQERITETFLVPTMVKRLIVHEALPSHDVSSLGLLLYGAAPMDPALLADAMRAFPNAGFAQAYGMTELSPVTCILSTHVHDLGPASGKLASAGQPIAIAQVAVRRPDGSFCEPGEVGEIVAKGPMAMKGYWNRPEETAAALRDGWMHTGDAGSMDEDGYVTIVDRVKDMIITGGENVYSVEVENVLASMPEVLLCGVIAVPDESWGERVHAVVVPRPGATLTPEAVTAFCRQRMAGYKCPRSVELRQEMPLSPVGKVLKHELRREHWQGRNRNVG